MGEPAKGPTGGVNKAMPNLEPMPQCIAGIAIGTSGHDQVVLQSLPPRGADEVAVSQISDLTLAAILCTGLYFS